MTAIGGAVGVGIGDLQRLELGPDLVLLRQDPLTFEQVDALLDAEDGVSLTVDLGGVSEILEATGEVGQVETQRGLGVQVEAQARWGRWRPFARVLVRDVAFTLRDVPSFVPYQALNDALELRPDLWGEAGLAIQSATVPVLVAVDLVVHRPASLAAIVQAGSFPGTALSGETTVLVSPTGALTIMPEGEDVLPGVAGQIHALWRPSSRFVVLGSIYVSRDPNNAHYADDTSGIAQRTVSVSWAAGWSLLVNAAW